MKIETLLFIVLLFLSFSCKEHTASNQHVIGFSQCVGSDNWRKQMLDEMNLELEFYPELSLIYKDADGDNETQIKQIKELIEANIDVLLVSPNESEPLTQVVDEAYEKGIPVILLDRKTNSENYTTFIGADNFEIGRNAGMKAASLLKGKGRIVEISGLQGSSPAFERHQGFMDIINQYEDISILKKIYGNWIGLDAAKELKETFTTADSIDLIFAHNDVMARTAYNFLDSLQKTDIKVIGIDGLAGVGNGIDLVNKKILSATVLYPTGGEEAILYAAKLLEGDSIPREVVLSSTLIDEINSRIMEQQANKVIGQQAKISQLNNQIIGHLKEYNIQRIFLYLLAAGIIVQLLLMLRILLSYKIIRSQKATIQEQNNHLEELNETKDKFFSIVAHDLKSPLYSLKSFSSLIIEDFEIIEKEEMIEMMKQLNESVENTITMANNLITWAKIQMKDVQHQEEILNLKDILSNICDVYENVAIGKGLNVSCSVNENLQILGDKNQIEFIIRNLVNNAIKFTNKGDFVKIIADKLPDNYVEIAISDNGVGISEKVKNSLFSIGMNQSTMGTAGEKGTGLGLMLCFEFVKQNNGEINVESEVGKGTTFHIRLKSN